MNKMPRLLTLKLRPESYFGSQSIDYILEKQENPQKYKQLATTEIFTGQERQSFKMESIRKDSSK